MYRTPPCPPAGDRTGGAEGCLHTRIHSPGQCSLPRRGRSACGPPPDSPGAGPAAPHQNPRVHRPEYGLPRQSSRQGRDWPPLARASARPGHRYCPPGSREPGGTLCLRPPGPDGPAGPGENPAPAVSPPRPAGTGPPT